MTPWKLPAGLMVGGQYWNIRTDFRTILDILSYFNNPEYELDEKWEIFLRIFYIDFEELPQDLYAEAMVKAMDFINMGIVDDGKKRPATMDWEQDAPFIISSVNHVLGKEIRSLDELHWWTFLGAYMEISGGLFSKIVEIRNKRARGKKLEKDEMAFYVENKKLIDLKVHYTETEQEENQKLLDIF